LSRYGGVARDTMLGLMKTCKKLGLSFYHYLGDRLGISGQVGSCVDAPGYARSF